jgi:ATP-dependent Clp protease ATP-binding subunit ClpA
MEFLWENSYFYFPPLIRFVIKKIKESFDIFVFICLNLVFLFSFYWLLQGEIKNQNLFFLILLFYFITLVIFWKRKRSKEDLRLLRGKILDFDDILNKETKDFLIDSLTLAEILKPQNFYLFLLKNIIKKRKIKKILFRLETEKNLDKKIQIIFYKKKIDKFSLNYFKEVLEILKLAYFFSLKINFPEINLPILFYALSQVEDIEVQRFLEENRLNSKLILSSVLFEIYQRKFLPRFEYQPFSVFHKEIEEKRFLPLNLFKKPTPFLDKFGIDLTYYACKKNLGFLIGHESEFNLLIEKLKEKKKLLLVGKKRSGKKTIVFHLAWKIHNELVPSYLLDYRVILLDLYQIFEKNKEKFIEIISKIKEEIKESEKLIVFIPEIDKFLTETDFDLSEFFNVPQTIFILSLSYEDFLLLNSKSLFLKDFEKIKIEELKKDEALFLLTLRAIFLEKEKKITISPRALVSALEIASLFYQEKYIVEAGEEIILKSLSIVKKNKGNFLSEEIVRELSLSFKKEIEVFDVINLESLLKEKIINQEFALNLIASLLKIKLSGLEIQFGPLAVFLFLGPEGVGKTETAKTLAKIFYGSERSIYKLDLKKTEEFEDFLNHFFVNPYSLIFLEDLEDIDEKSLPIFKKILNEGEFEKNGRKFDFKKSIVIIFSKTLSKKVVELLENKENLFSIREKIKKEIEENEIWKELKIDEIVIFDYLTYEKFKEIAKNIFKDIKTDFLLKYQFDINLEESALEEIVKRYASKENGAEFLKENIERIIKNNLAKLILEGKIKRNSRVSLSFEGEFVLKEL